MLKLVFILLSFCFISFGFSQRVIPTGQTNGVYPVSIQSTNQANILAPSFEGQRFRIKADNGVEGDPFLFEDWKAGEVILKNNEKYHIDRINLDASDNKFIYNQNDTVYEFLDNVAEIKIYGENHVIDSASDMIFMAGINPASPDFVQILASGKITVIKKYAKKPEGENYSNGIVNNSRKYTLRTTQYALVDKILTPLKFDSATLEALTSDKKAQVDAYLKENKLKPKKAKDFLMAVAYYNSISTTAN